MIFDEALRRYTKGTFTDHDVTSCTGLSVRAWRELIKIGAVRTVTENRGPGRVRLCDATTFKRAAVIAALNRARFSLAVSGKVAYLLPIDELIYDFYDPCTILLDVLGDVDPESGLPPRLELPKADWFDPDKPAKADPEGDWLIDIYEDRFVALAYSVKAQDQDRPWIYGDLREEGTRFISWHASHRQTPLVATPLPYRISEFIAKWQDPLRWADRIDPEFLDYEYEDHSGDGDPLRVTAHATARSPLFKTTVNATLAVRKALRRYLGIEPAVPDFASGERA
jgi:hypothetical protein